MSVKFKIVLVFLLLAFSYNLSCQEYLKPLNGNINLINYQSASDITPAKKQTIKTLSTSDSLPFFDDFSYAPLSPYPDANKWTDSSVYINSGFAIAPPSIGVATFDGLNKYGYPYNIAALPVVSVPTDTLTSRPINLFANSTKTYTPMDSIGFTFYYQAAGFGDNPEVGDSLMLEFYKPKSDKWQWVWGTRGVSNPVIDDSTFKRVFIYVIDTAYFHDGFRFRFRNKATPSGSLDHWHVDFVRLDQNLSQLSDTVLIDAAFGYVPRPFLKNYSAMPYKQYIPTEMGSRFANFVRNNNTIDLNLNYSYKVYDKTGAPLPTFTYSASDNIKPFKPNGWVTGNSAATPTITGVFPVPGDTTYFKIVHIISTTPDNFRGNDTVVQLIHLNNYYAYDDGSAEAGYYLNTNGAKLALRFTLNNTDTLQAMDIFFDPITQGNFIKASGFRMFVWGEGSSQPGDIILKDSVMYPVYLDYGYNKIPRYKLSAPLVLNPGTYYFGMQQLSNQPLNIGFDRNINRNHALYYDVNGFWQQSAIKGSLMIHPVFGRNEFATGINEERSYLTEKLIKLYPNPANDALFIYLPINEYETGYSLEIYSSIGQKVLRTDLYKDVNEINTERLSQGMYFVVLKQNSAILTQQKLIISR